jgi:Predicted redox protein, regulator of disulfide bond formation
MKVDEPPDRGGTATGPSPLLHFLAGVGTCLLTQFLRVSIAEGYNLRYTGAKVRGEYTRCMGGVYESIVCDVRAEGVLSEADAERLAERAEAHCIAHSTLKKVIKITTVFHLNGQEVVRRVS